MTTLLALSLAVGVLTLATPVALQALVDAVAFGGLLQPLLILALVLLARARGLARGPGRVGGP